MPTNKLRRVAGLAMPDTGCRRLQQAFTTTIANPHGKHAHPVSCLGKGNLRMGRVHGNSGSVSQCGRKERGGFATCEYFLESKKSGN